MSKSLASQSTAVSSTEVAREVQEVGGGFIMPFWQRIKTNPAREAHQSLH